jgi:hypothetical protein
MHHEGNLGGLARVNDGEAFGETWGERLLHDQRLRAVLSKPGAVTELVVHPGYTPDPDLPLPDQLPPERRQGEYDLLSRPAFRCWLDDLGVTLISFADLRRNQT